MGHPTQSGLSSDSGRGAVTRAIVSRPVVRPPLLVGSTLPGFVEAYVLTRDGAPGRKKRWGCPVCCLTVCYRLALPSLYRARVRRPTEFIEESRYGLSPPGSYALLQGMPVGFGCIGRIATLELNKQFERQFDELTGAAAIRAPSIDSRLCLTWLAFERADLRACARPMRKEFDDAGRMVGPNGKEARSDLISNARD